MSIPNNLSSAPLERHMVLTLSIVPIESEDDDLDTLAITKQLYTDVQQELTQVEGYITKPLLGNDSGTKTRNIDLVLLITALGAAIAAYKDLLTSLFQTITTVVNVLAKRGRVGEIEIRVDGKTLVLRDASKKTAQELIAAFEEQHPGATRQLPPNPTVTVNAKITKRGKKRQR